MRGYLFLATCYSKPFLARPDPAVPPIGGMPSGGTTRPPPSRFPHGDLVEADLRRARRHVAWEKGREASI